MVPVLGDNAQIELPVNVYTAGFVTEVMLMALVWLEQLVGEAPVATT